MIQEKLFDPEIEEVVLLKKARTMALVEYSMALWWKCQCMTRDEVIAERARVKKLWLS